MNKHISTSLVRRWLYIAVGGKMLKKDFLTLIQTALEMRINQALNTKDTEIVVMFEATRRELYLSTVPTNLDEPTSGVVYDLKTNKFYDTEQHMSLVQQLKPIMDAHNDELKLLDYCGLIINDKEWQQRLQKETWLKTQPIEILLYALDLSKKGHTINENMLHILFETPNGSSKIGENK